MATCLDDLFILCYSSNSGHDLMIYLISRFPTWNDPVRITVLIGCGCRSRWVQVKHPTTPTPTSSSSFKDHSTQLIKFYSSYKNDLFWLKCQSSIKVLSSRNAVT